MKVNMKKTMIIGVIALFVSVSMAPLISATQLQEEETYAVEYSMINPDGSISEETVLLDAEELALLQGRLSKLLDLLRSTTDKNLLISLLMSFLTGSNHPIFSKIVQYFLSSELLNGRQIVASQGWGYTLNPFKKTSTDIIKPVTIWKYAASSDTLPIPSTTGVLRLNPLEMKTFGGSQLGVMLRFRGIYVHIPQQMPAMSYTFFLGTAKYVFGAEVPTITLPTF